jgi:hypothetical protein
MMAGRSWPGRARLTMDRYTHLVMLDVAGGLDLLPPLPRASTPAPDSTSGETDLRRRQA